MRVLFRRLSRRDMTVESGIIRAATLAMAFSWLLWLIQASAWYFPRPGWLSHWYSVITVVLFATANLMMLISWASGRDDLMKAANRFAGFTVPVAMTLLLIAYVLGDSGPHDEVWFYGFSGLPAVAFALTVPMRVGIPWFVVNVGGTALVDTILQGRWAWDVIAGEVGFGLVNTFVFVVFAAAAVRASRVTDAVEGHARRDFARAARLKTRTDENTRFTALVHDHVLSELDAIAAGLKPSRLVDLRFGVGVHGTGVSNAARFVDMVTECVRAESPGCAVSVVDECRGRAIDFSDDMVNAMLLSLAEVARNSKSHAGPSADRRCTVEISPFAVTIVYADDGPGFDPEKISPTRAGLRVSVLGRMASVEGCSAVLEAAPGRGVSVTLAWVGGEPEPPVAEIPPGAESQSDYSILGMDVVFSWQYGLSFVGVMALIVFSGGWYVGISEVAVVALIAACVAFLIPGREPVLPMGRTIWLVGTGVAMSVVGLWREEAGDPEGWNAIMHVNALALVAALLAVRGRPWASAVLVLGSAALLQILAWSGISPAPHIDGAVVLANSIPLVAAVLVHFGLKYFFRRLPRAWADQRRAEVAAATASELTERRSKNLIWLENEVQPVLDAAKVVFPPTEELRMRARLTELRLRDIIRSPLLDLPAVRASCWDARARGVTVRLLDDFTGWYEDTCESGTGADREDGKSDAAAAHAGDSDVAGEFEAASARARAAVQAALGPMIRALDDARDGEAVTIRVLPPGRASSVTIVDRKGVKRFTGADAIVG